MPSCATVSALRRVVCARASRHAFNSAKAKPRYGCMSRGLHDSTYGYLLCAICVWPREAFSALGTAVFAALASAKQPREGNLMGHVLASLDAHGTAPRDLWSAGVDLLNEAVVCESTGYVVRALHWLARLAYHASGEFTKEPDAGPPHTDIIRQMTHVGAYAFLATRALCNMPWWFGDDDDAKEGYGFFRPLAADGSVWARWCRVGPLSAQLVADVNRVVGECRQTPRRRVQGRAILAVLSWLDGRGLLAAGTGTAAA